MASIDTTLHSQLVGQGESARAAQEAMDALAHRAAERVRDPNRTFAAGLDWFCRHVKAKAEEERYMPPTAQARGTSTPEALQRALMLTYLTSITSTM